MEMLALRPSKDKTVPWKDLRGEAPQKYRILRWEQEGGRSGRLVLEAQGSLVVDAFRGRQDSWLWDLPSRTEELGIFLSSVGHHWRV